MLYSSGNQHYQSRVDLDILLPLSCQSLKMSNKIMGYPSICVTHRKKYAFWCLRKLTASGQEGGGGRTVRF